MMYIQDLKPLVPLGPLGTMKETIEALGNYIIHTIDVHCHGSIPKHIIVHEESW